MSADAFYAPPTHALEEEVTAGAEAGPSSMGDGAASLSLDAAFDISNTAKLILSHGYKTIGLQFPDELLPSSVGVYRALQREIGGSGAQAYVLADSTYGACCPDVLSCLHLPADLLVHYGHACLTLTDAIPVHYVFPRRRLDAGAAAAALKDVSEEALRDVSAVKDVSETPRKGVIVIWDVAYDWVSDDIEREFTALGLPISFSHIRRPHDSPKGKAPALRSIDPPAGFALDDCILWYIGDEGRSLLNVQMTHAANDLYAYSGSRAWAVHPSTSRLLSRRLYALHQAMAADVFGLVVGNVGLASSKELVAELRRALKAAQKKSYTLSVGRLNPAKLANFAEIECFVLIGCAEGGVVDSKEFLRPIITPYELTLALNQGEWDPSKWTLDLGTVLAEAETVGDRKNPDEDEELEFSLVTGTYRSRKAYGVEEITDGAGVKDLTLRSTDFSLAKLESAGSVFLQTRSFQGLEPRYGLDEPAELEQGRMGIARGYTEEK